ncbi:MAG: hypothetical protein BWY25_02581 [Chloroflexi bacterium ADurb.Bin222]|nr:MAG: hypothetical protein BWY25_02581 [Chloroflexi bacterium ADurb.Bin222]
MQALPDLIETQGQPIVRIAVLAGADVELKTVVDAIGLRPAQVIGDVARPQHRPADAAGDRHLRRQHPHPHRARLDDLVLEQEGLHRLHFFRQALAHQLASALDPALRQISRHPAGTHVVAHHPRARNRLEEIQNQFAFLQGVQRAGEVDPQLIAEESRRQHVIDDARQFGHDDAEVLRPFGDFPAKQFFQRQAVSQAVCHPVDIIQAIREGEVLQPGVALADLLVIAMQISKNRLEVLYRLPVEPRHHTKDAVRAGMVRAEIDDQLFRAEGLVGIAVRREHPLIEQPLHFLNATLGTRQPPVRQADIRAEGRARFRRERLAAVRKAAAIRLVLGLEVRLAPIFAHRMSLEPFPHQQAPQIGMSLEAHAEEIPHLALLEIRRREMGGQRGQPRLLAVHPRVHGHGRPAAQP